MIKANNVTFGYNYYNEKEDKKEKNIAVSEVSISIDTGSFVAILGHNGSGKSTLAKLMNGLLIPDEGSIFVKGLDSKIEENIWNIRQHCGMVFQNPVNQIIATIVEEDVAFGPENLGIESSEIRKRVDEALKAVGMEDYKRATPSNLSGGQKQRIAIAGVLAMKPKCIVLDESTAMLDPNGRKEVLETAMRLNKEEKITVVLITHFMEEAVLTDKVFVMNKGKISMEGTPKEIFKNINELRELGLDVPQVTELAYNLRNAGINIKEDVLSIEEMVEEICNYN